MSCPDGQFTLHKWDRNKMNPAYNKGCDYPYHANMFLVQRMLPSLIITSAAYIQSTPDWFYISQKQTLWTLIRLLLWEQSDLGPYYLQQRLQKRESWKQNEPWHEISNNVACATSKDSDQPAHTRSLIRAFACRMNILWLLSYWPNMIWVFKLKRKLHRLVWVYTCQPVTLLETSCHGSIFSFPDR